MTIEVGQEAPDFELPSTEGDPVRLSDFRGKQHVVITFYPFTFTGNCHTELCELRDDLSGFATSEAQVLAISCDSKFAQKKWADEENYGFPILSDFWPHGETTRAYGVFDEAVGCANRATFVVNKQGVVVDAFITPDRGTIRTRAEYEAALGKLS